MKGAFIYFCCFALFISCRSDYAAKERIDAFPAIFPDYVSVHVPLNIAPLNFGIEDAARIAAVFSSDSALLFTVSGKNHIEIPKNKWQKALAENAGKELNVEVSVWSPQYPDGVRYRSFPIYVANDSIDPWIAYRLIEPGYESWNIMEIRERELSSFKEKVIVSNRMADKGCVNCHSFENYSPDNFMFHLRGANGGTIIVKGNKPEKIQLNNMGPKMQGAYPFWHPSGKYIVYSSNQTRQSFHSFDKRLIDVYDLSSDLILYDVVNNKVVTDERFLTKDYFETFPAWSPDGKRLYFCRAKAVKMPDQIKDLQYLLCSVVFDESTGKFGNKIDTIGATKNKSVSFPRISPDGKYLLYTETDYATFPIWHKEADLNLIALCDSVPKPVSADAINSPDAESYHSWSSNGRWVVFSSRRIDGLYTRLFISWFDEDGKFHKPFLLPQKSPYDNTLRMKSYNIPEFVNGEINVPELEKIFAN